jgi:hypothetical protein
MQAMCRAVLPWLSSALKRSSSSRTSSLTFDSESASAAMWSGVELFLSLERSEWSRLQLLNLFSLSRRYFCSNLSRYLDRYFIKSHFAATWLNYVDFYNSI